MRKARKTGKENDWSTYRRLRNSVTRSIRYSKATYTKSILQENIDRPKQFWDKIKRCFPTKSTNKQNSRVFEINGKQTSDLKAISNGFCTFFASIGKALQKAIPSLSDNIWKHHDYETMKQTINPKSCRFHFKPTNKNEVLAILRKIKRRKAPGHDNIPTCMIIDGANEISAPLSELINHCLETSVFPSEEKIAKVTPIYKSGERSSMDNYRPISVLPVLSKVIERVVHQQVYDYLEKNELLSRRQFGFRNRSSTQHAVTLFSDSIRKNMDKSLMTGAVFIDLSKAFDTVDHARLLSKLSIYGIKDREMSWFSSYLFNRKQYVAIDGQSSEMLPISCGVPQGSILGPLMFILLINDIESNLRLCNIILYSDDTVLFYAGKTSTEIENILGSELEQIARWLNKNNLVINLKKSKTECVLYGTQQKTSKSAAFEVKLDGLKIAESAAYKYLGVVMDKSLTYAEHIEKTLKKAGSRVKLLSRIRPNLTPHAAETIYRVMILPLLIYCNNIFVEMSPSKKQRFESIPIRSLKIINGRRNSVKLPSINHIRNRMCAVEVFKCLNGLAPPDFIEYFQRLQHGKATRGNEHSLLLPRVKSEAGRKTFAFQGVKIFNKVPNKLKSETSVLKFKSNCKDFNFDF